MPIEGEDGAMPATPNRDAYSQMWSEDNGDIDFEDKEARYGRAIDDRNELRERRNADASLGRIFDEHGWLGEMYSELSQNPDMNPFEWLAGFCQQNDVTLEEVMDNDEARKRLSEKMANFKAKQAKDKKTNEARRNAVEQSYEELKSLSLGEDEEREVWGAFWKMIEDADEGKVSTNTWQAFVNSRNYDSDVESARNEGAMKARNEKIQNKVRRPSEEAETLPPTLPQGIGTPMGGSKKPKKENDSFLSGLNG